MENSRTRTAAVVFAGFCAFLTLYAPQPLLPMLREAFHASATAVSRLITVSTLAVAMAAPFAGAVADRIGRKRVIVPSALLLAIPTLLSATAGGLGSLLFWRFWQGVFTPGIFAVTIAYINEEWDTGAGSAMSAYVGGTVLGGFSGRMVSAFVAGHSSWRGAFVALALLDVLGGIAMWAWLPADRMAATRTRQRVSTVRAMLRHMRNTRLVATYCVGFCVLFTLVAAFTYVNFYLADPPFRLSTAALGLLFVVYLVGAVVTPIAGRSIDRVGHRFALAAAFAVGAAGIVLTLIPHLAIVMAGLALCCTGVFIGQSAASSYIGTVAEEARAAAVGLYVMFYYIGGSFGAELPGHLWSRGGWPACVALIGGVQLATIGIGLAFWRQYRPVS
ncbi:MAG TPA: MFS transporter [Candidatus Limnocylindrales bacterium]|nr:MFS transporter [Candidatus Limnocylindrales bacterium]